MFRQTRKRLAFQFTAIIGTMLMILIVLFVFLLTGVVSRSESVQLSDLANRAKQEWEHHVLEAGSRQDPFDRLFRSNPEQGRMSWEFVQPQQFVVVTDSDGKELALYPVDASRAPAFRQAVAEVRSAGGGVTKVTFKQADGTKRIYSAMQSPYISMDGATHLLFYVGEDVTDRKRLMLEIGWLLAGLSVALLALSSVAGYILSDRAMVPIAGAFRRQQQFTADASHELRTPLSVLQSSVEIVQEEADTLPEFHREVLRGMHDEIGRMARMTESLLLLARNDEHRSAPAIAEVDAAELAQSAVRNFIPYAQKHAVSLTYTGETTPTPIIGDRDQLGQLLYILLDNAVKYSPAGTAVEVGCRRTAGKFVEWTVRDEGIGIEGNDLPLIFERFYRVDKARSREAGGTGLGLSVAASIVAAHDGRISVTSRPGEGSTFTVTLPLASGNGAVHPRQ